MKRLLIHATQPDEVRVAIVEGSRLIDLDTERPEFQQKKANIYKGVISSIEPSLGAVFVHHDNGRHGFLPLKEISPEYYLRQPAENETPDIRSLLKVGQELVVQIEKEERGTKGAALTTYISLAGSYLVLMPNNPRAGGVSRRVENDERDQLKETLAELNAPEGMGLIVRTAGVGRTKEELEWDLSVLLRYWEAIKQAAVARPGPYLIHQESDVIIRAIRDYLRQDMQEVIIDEPKAFEKARNYISQVRPDFVNKVKLYSDPLPLFSRFKIEIQIETAYQREVSLPSGGSIVIDHTEALVAIDINSARATKGSNIEETAYNTNLEAADEIPRQLRIRGISGLIVIDFIDMLSSTHQRDVENRLRNGLNQDRARIQMGRISKFGLLEMSRQSLRSSLRKSSRVTCPRCDGQGAIRSVESMALSIIHLLQEQSVRSSEMELDVQLPIDVATYILNEKRDALNEIKQNNGVDVVIVPNPFFESPQYQIKQVRKERTGQMASYQMIKIPKPGAAPGETSPTKSAVEPAITEFLTTMAEPPPRKKSSRTGVIKRIWEVMFGPVKEMETKKSKITTDRPYSEGRKDHPSKRHRHGERERPAHEKTRSTYGKSTEKTSYEKSDRGRTRRKGSSTEKRNYYEKDSQANIPSQRNNKEVSPASQFNSYEAEEPSIQETKIPKAINLVAPKQSATSALEPENRQQPTKPSPSNANPPLKEQATKDSRKPELTTAIEPTISQKTTITPPTTNKEPAMIKPVPGYKGFGHNTTGVKPLQQVTTKTKPSGQLDKPAEEKQEEK